MVAGFAVGELCSYLTSRTGRYGAMTIGALVLASWTLVLALWLISVLPFVRMVPPSSREATFVLENVSRLPSQSILLESEPLVTNDERLIAPLVIPAFVIDDANLGISVSAMKEASLLSSNAGKPVLVYIGLQSHVHYAGENPATVQRPRIDPRISHLRSRLVPVVTTTIDTSGPTPGPELEFSSENVEIGFYRLVVLTRKP